MKCMESGIWNFLQSACVCVGRGGGGIMLLRLEFSILSTAHSHLVDRS